MAQWLLQVSQIDSCAILPIIAEDGFRFPTQSFYDDLSTYSQLEKVDLRTYVRVIKTVFQEMRSRLLTPEARLHGSEGLAKQNEASPPLNPKP